MELKNMTATRSVGTRLTDLTDWTDLTDDGATFDLPAEQLEKSVFRHILHAR